MEDPRRQDFGNRQMAIAADLDALMAQTPDGAAPDQERLRAIIDRHHALIEEMKAAGYASDEDDPPLVGRRGQTAFIRVRDESA